MKCQSNTIKEPILLSSHKLFVKDALQDIHWFGHSVMKPVDYMAFQKRGATREGNNESTGNN